MISTKDGARRARRRTRAAISIVVAVGAAAAFAGPANANLTAMSSDLDLFGFPTYYQDSTGLQAGLCIEDPQCPASPAAKDFTPAKDGEAFYQLANATVSGDDGESVTVDFNVEAAYLDGTPITFGRIQFTAGGLAPNSIYTVDHPYGQSHFTTDENGELKSGDRAAQREETDGTFSGTLLSPIGPFLRSTTAPPGYLGNGVTPTTVTGGPIRNTMTVTGPGLPDATTSTDPDTGQTVILVPAGITTDEFVVEGRQFDPSVPLPVPPPPVAADADRDGVPDNMDRCIGQVGPSSNGGCPIIGPASIPSKSTNSAGVDRATIIQVVQPGAAQVLGVKATSPLAVSGLTLARRISMARVQQQGLRASMQVKEGTNVVRISIYKARNGKKAGSALFVTNRVARAGLLRMTLRSRSLLAKLRAGTYVLEARSGQSLGSLAAPRRITFTVTP